MGTLSSLDYCRTATQSDNWKDIESFATKRQWSFKYQSMLLVLSDAENALGILEGFLSQTQRVYTLLVTVDEQKRKDAKNLFSKKGNNNLVTVSDFSTVLSAVIRNMEPKKFCSVV